MSEPRTDCDRFDAWLLEGAPRQQPTELENSEWRKHLDRCDECSAQWHAHQLLVMAFATEEVPELSPAFDAGLDRKLAAAVEIRPLSGWRKAAMLAYAAVAAALLAWALKGVPLPAIDPSAPWVPIVTLVAVPLTFMMAIAASRLIPGRGLPKGSRMLAVPPGNSSGG